MYGCIQPEFVEDNLARVVSVVEKYRLALEEGSPSHRVADEIAPLIKQWGQE